MRFRENTQLDRQLLLIAVVHVATRRTSALGQNQPVKSRQLMVILVVNLIEVIAQHLVRSEREIHLTRCCPSAQMLPRERDAGDQLVPSTGCRFVAMFLGTRVIEYGVVVPQLCEQLFHFSP